MSFAGFVFDMIRRDKENRNQRNLRRERLSDRLDRIYEKGHREMPLNTTAEDMKEIARRTVQKERSEQRYSIGMTLIILGVCIAVVAISVFLFIR